MPQLKIMIWSLWLLASVQAMDLLFGGLNCLKLKERAEEGAEELESLIAGYRGRVMKHHRYWFGIPYAKAGRWQSPQLVNLDDHGEKDATKWGQMCPQLIPVERNSSLYNLFQTKDASEGEDCLNLHIYAPRVKLIKEPLPVIVFIYGGFLVQGAASMPLYDPRHAVGLASLNELKQQAIWVVPNYRHGPFGFGLHPQHGGNHGLQDVLAALQWTQAHIHHWGGDAGRVTVAGFSAGSCLVNWLQFVEAERRLREGVDYRPLFHRAYLSSGNAWTLPLRTGEEAQWDTFGMAVATGYEGEDLLGAVKHLEGIPWEQLLQKTREANLLRIWAPVLDGQLIKRTPEEYLRLNLVLSVPRWWVAMAHDGSAFAPEALTSQLPDKLAVGLDPSLMVNALLPYFQDPSVIAKLLPIYNPTRTGSPRDALVALITDLFFICPAQRQATLLHPHLSRYEEMHTPINSFYLSMVPEYGVFHGSDILLLLSGLVDTFTAGVEARERSVTRLREFMAFAHGGLDDNQSEVSNLLPARCQLLAKYPRTPLRLEAMGMRMPWAANSQQEIVPLSVEAELLAALEQEAATSFDRPRLPSKV